MIYRALADVVMVTHLGFIVFVVLGGLFALRWRWFIAVHIPAAAWGFLIAAIGWRCPLTPLENWLRAMGGQAGYETSFIEHYLLPVIYPGGLTMGLRIGMALAVLGVNLLIYGWWWRQGMARASSP